MIILNIFLIALLIKFLWELLERGLIPNSLAVLSILLLPLLLGVGSHWASRVFRFMLSLAGLIIFLYLLSISDTKMLGGFASLFLTAIGLYLIGRSFR